MDRHEQQFREWAQEFEAVEAYEFTYHPTFTNSFGASLWQTYSGDLYASMWIDDRMRTRTEVQELGDLDPIAWRLLHEALERTRFWTDPEWIVERGRDGSNWYFEGLKNDQYLFRHAWSPDKGDPAYELGRFFFSLVPSDFAFVVYDDPSYLRFEGVAFLKRFPTIFVA